MEIFAGGVSQSDDVFMVRTRIASSSNPDSLNLPCID